MGRGEKDPASAPPIKMGIERRDETPNRVDEYMESLKKIFFGYEAWFKNKKGRNRESVPKN